MKKYNFLKLFDIPVSKTILTETLIVEPGSIIVDVKVF